MPAGRPPLYKTVEDMEMLIESYFKECDSRTRSIYSVKRDEVLTIPNPEPYTMSGLAYRLGMNRQTLLNYSKKDKFIGTIKKARDRVEMDIERRMNDKETFTPGLIFNAKNNFDWRDRQELTGADGGPVENSTTVTFMPKQLPDQYWKPEEAQQS
jgi:hypothetical protein